MNPFYPKWRAFKDAEYEMRLLKRVAPTAIPEICATLPGFAGLNDAYSFHIFNDVAATVQASFGNRSMFRTKLKGGTACENGPSLVYSQGPTGDIIVVLYPTQSDIARVNEKLIFLRMQQRSGARLIDGFRRDLKDLIAYAHVGSIDGSPTWRQWTRIQWLRLTRRSQYDSDFDKPTDHRPIADIAKAIPKTVGTSALGGLVRMLIPLLVLSALGYLGFSQLATKLAESRGSGMRVMVCEPPPSRKCERR